jgi:hypothetical protein
MTLKVWLDDVREPPDASWRWVTTPGAAISLLAEKRVALMSLDHDLGYDAEGRELNSREVVNWIEQEVVLRGYDPPKMRVHSANPPGREWLLRAVEAIHRRVAER